MLVLGISAYYHDSAAALVHDGAIVAAAQEERFSRKKADSSFPEHAIRYCLNQAGTNFDELDFIGFYDKPILTFDRLFETYLSYAPKGFGSFVQSIPIWIKEKLLIKDEIVKQLSQMDLGVLAAEKLLFGFHHNSHAASAFYPSPFEEAAIVVADGVGEWATTSLVKGQGSKIEMLSEVRFPHSLGLLYSAFTQYLGFKVNDGEYKVMGLAPYGEPVYASRIRNHLIDVKPDGSFRLDMNYFNYCTGLTMINDRFCDLFDEIPARNPATPLAQRDMDIARSIQEVIEEVILLVCKEAHRLTGSKNLCLAGGVALNCVANAKVLKDGPFEKVWVQPASGDAGGALGIALQIAMCHGDPRQIASDGRDSMAGAYLGPSFDDEEIRKTLDTCGATYTKLLEEELIEKVTEALSTDKIVGWMQGRMEFGPRALGNRSILGNPRSIEMQKMLNMKIKYRESFRPFAPAILSDYCQEYFYLDVDSPYMLLVSDVREEHRLPLSSEADKSEGIERLNFPRSTIPAITHVDYSARVQTVNKETNPLFHRLLSAFKAMTGCPILVNTSFNIRDEPIVCTAKDAYQCFMGTEMDVLAVGNFLLYKNEQ